MSELVLMNNRTERAVADRVEVAVTRSARRRGLLGRARLAVSDAMVLAPCAAVHTMFMQFAIDVVFVDKEGRVVRLVRDLSPWRMAVAPFAHAVVELPVGGIGANRVAVGDQLYLDRNGERVQLAATELRNRC